MGMEVLNEVTAEQGRASAVSDRPSVVIVGPRNVGKHSLLKRLMTKEELLKDESSPGLTCHGWTIDTEYYTADVCIRTVRLDELDSNDNSPPLLEHCEALLMVFDLSDPSTFEKLQQWVEASDLTHYEVQMCVGNKADRLPSHFGHIEYRRWLTKRGESSSDPHPDFMDFGIDRTEGSGLLVEEEDEDPELRRRTCIEWCTERGIEYLEACAINEAFDKCMSVDGDLQGVPRILGALSAHMWPDLVMKPREKLTNVQPDSKENDEDGESSSEDEEDYLIEFELLSNASTEPWDGNEDMWGFRSADAPPLNMVSSIAEYEIDDSVGSATAQTSNVLDGRGHNLADTASSSSPVSHVASISHNGGDQIVLVQHSDRVNTPDTSATSADVIEAVGISNIEVTEKPVSKNKEHGAEDLEKVMHDMTSMRENMNMSDGQRREMAAQLAVRMASMFLDDDGEVN